MLRPGAREQLLGGLGQQARASSSDMGEEETVSRAAASSFDASMAAAPLAAAPPLSPLRRVVESLHVRRMSVLLWGQWLRQILILALTNSLLFSVCKPSRSLLSDLAAPAQQLLCRLFAVL